MLNWDDYGKEDTNTSSAVSAAAPVVETPQVAKEQPAVAPVDTAAPIKESANSIEEGTRAQKAREAIKNLDDAAGVEELDEMAGSRVQVDDKMMINCKAEIGRAHV